MGAAGQLERKALWRAVKRRWRPFGSAGVSALAHTAEFLQHPACPGGDQPGTGKNIVFDDRALSIIEAASKEYHEAGRH
ncbi:MAG: hypothetical protein ACLR0U_22255 [Enterocloster clostridioformis]